MAKNLAYELDQISKTPTFLSSDSETQQELLRRERDRYIAENPEESEYAQSVAEERNKTFLRATGQGRHVPTNLKIEAPWQSEDFEFLSEEERQTEIEKFKLKIPEIAAQDTLNREDNEFYLKQVADAQIRAVKGEDTGYIADKAYRAFDGFAAGLANYVGAEEIAENIRRSSAENPKYDEDFGAILAQGAGDMAASTAIFLGAAAAATAVTGNPVAGGYAGTTATLATNGISRYNEAYRIAIEKGLDDNQAHEAGIFSLPGAAVDALGDRLIASKLLPARATRNFNVPDGVAKRKALTELIADKSKRGVLMQVARNAFVEGASEAVGDYTAGYGGFLATGETDFIPKGKDLATSFAVGAILGGGISAASDTPGLLRGDSGKLSSIADNIDKLSVDKAKNVYDLVAQGKYNDALKYSREALASSGTTSTEPADTSKPDGEKPDGLTPDGEKPDGEKPDTVGPIGEKPDGEKPDGEKPDGEKPDGEIDNSTFFASDEESDARQQQAATVKPEENETKEEKEERKSKSLFDKLNDTSKRSFVSSVLTQVRSALSSLSPSDLLGQLGSLSPETASPVKGIRRGTADIGAKRQTKDAEYVRSLQEKANNIKIVDQESPGDAKGLADFSAVERKQGNEIPKGEIAVQTSGIKTKIEEAVAVKKADSIIAIAPVNNQDEQSLKDNNIPFFDIGRIKGVVSYDSNGETLYYAETEQAFDKILDRLDKAYGKDNWALKNSMGFGGKDSVLTSREQAKKAFNKENETSEGYGFNLNGWYSEDLIADIAQENRVKGSDFRVHAVKRNGKIEIIPYATHLRSSLAPFFIRDKKVRDIEKAALEELNKANDVIQENEFFGVDVVETKGGKLVVTEFNPTTYGAEAESYGATGQSGYMENEYIQAATYAHLKGRTPGFVFAARQIIRQEIQAQAIAKGSASVANDIRSIFNAASDQIAFANELRKNYGEKIGDFATEIYNSFTESLGVVTQKIVDMIQKIIDTIKFIPVSSIVSSVNQAVMAKAKQATAAATTLARGQTSKNSAKSRKSKAKKSKKASTAQQVKVLPTNAFDLLSMANSDFLKKLINGNTKILDYLKTISVERSTSTNEFDGNTIRIFNDFSIDHELTHAVLEYSLVTNPEFNKELTSIVEALTESLKKDKSEEARKINLFIADLRRQSNYTKSDRTFSTWISDNYKAISDLNALKPKADQITYQQFGIAYGLSSPSEFVAQLFSDTYFRNFIDKYSFSKNETIFEKFIKAIRNLFKGNSSVDEIAEKISNFVSSSEFKVVKKSIKDYYADRNNNSNNSSTTPLPGININSTQDQRYSTSAAPQLPAMVDNYINDLKSFVSNGKMKLKMNAERVFDIFGERMYSADIGSVIIKELSQNSFDAVKAAVEKGHLKSGEGIIQVAQIDKNENDQFVISVEDNGIGMNEQILQEALFTLGGTNKETKKSSGGFGVAKIAMFMAAQRIVIKTTRDGITYSLDFTADQLKNYDFEFEAQATGLSSGTKITLYLPSEKDGKRIRANGPGNLILSEEADAFVTYKNPEDVPDIRTQVEKNYIQGVNNGSIKPSDLINAGYEVKRISNEEGSATIYYKKTPNRKKDGTKTYNYELPVKLKDNKEDTVPLSKSGYYVYSNGLLQFKSGGIPIDIQRPFGDNLNYSILMDINPSEDPTSKIYPFTNSREEFVKGSKMFGDLADFISELRKTEAVESFNKEFKVLVDSETGGPPVDKHQPVTYNNTTIQFDEQGKQFMKGVSKVIFDVSDLLLRTLKENYDFIGRDTVGPGAVSFLEIPDRGDNSYTNHKEEDDFFFGAGISKNWGGVNTRISPRAILVNPFYNKQVLDLIDHPRFFDFYPAHIYHIILHEINHIQQRNEGPGFTWSFANAEAAISANPEVRTEAIGIIAKYIQDNISTFKQIYEDYKGSDVLDAESEVGGNSAREVRETDGVAANTSDGRGIAGDFNEGNRGSQELNVTFGDLHSNKKDRRININSITDESSYPTDSVKALDPKAFNVVSTPRNLRKKQIQQLKDLKAHKIEDKFDSNTSALLRAVKLLKPSRIKNLPPIDQDRVWKLVSNIYEARSKKVKNPQARVSVKELLTELESYQGVIDTTYIEVKIKELDGIYDMGDVEFDGDIKKFQDYLDELHKQDEDFQRLKNSINAKRRAAYEKKMKAWRKQFAQVRADLLKNYPSAEEYLNEYEANEGKKITGKSLREFLLMHFDYLTNIADVSSMEGNELFLHFFAINNLSDQSFMYGGETTAKYIANIRDSELDLEKLENMFRDPVINQGGGFFGGLDAMQRSTEIAQSQLDRWSPFIEGKKFLEEDLMGPLLEAVRIESQNDEATALREYDELKKKFQELVGRDFNGEDAVSMAIASRLLQYEYGKDGNKEFLNNIKNELQNIANIVGDETAGVKGAGSASQQRDYRRSVIPVFEKLIAGLDGVSNPMEEFVININSRLGLGDTEVGKARTDLLNQMQAIMERFTLSNKVISELFYKKPFREYVNYLPNYVIPINPEQYTAGGEIADEMDKFDNLEWQTNSLTTEPGQVQTRKGIGNKGHYTNNIEFIFSRGVHVNTLTASTTPERFILNARLKGKVLKDLINGSDNSYRVDQLQHWARTVMAHAMHSGNPLGTVGVAIKTVTEGFARVALSGLHQGLTQTISGYTDYQIRTGNIAGAMKSAGYYMMHKEEMDNFFRDNAAWIDKRSFMGEQNIDRRRNPTFDDDAILNSPFVKKLTKIHEKAGEIITYSLRKGDDFTARSLILAEYARLIGEKNSLVKSIEDVDFTVVEGRLLSQAISNIERNINASNKATRGEFFVDRKRLVSTLRNVTVAFSSHILMLSAQFNIAARDLVDLHKQGGSNADKMFAIRTLGAILGQTFMFSSSRYLINGALATGMIAMMRDLFDDEEGKIAELEEKVRYAKDIGNDKLQEQMEHELKMARTVAKAIDTFKQRSLSFDGYWKSVVKDELGAVHFLFNGPGIPQRIIFPTFDRFGEMLMDEDKEARSDNLKRRIKGLKESGKYGQAARLEEELMFVENQEYMPWHIKRFDSSGLGGISGSALDGIYKSIGEFNDAAFGLNEININDFILSSQAMGIGQADLNRWFKFLDGIEDEEYKASKEREEKRKKRQEEIARERRATQDAIDEDRVLQSILND